MFKIKILVLGPCQSGKTAVSNFLADATDSTGGPYKPTTGVRILEFEVPNIIVSGHSLTAEVELWDCSGNKKFEGCWPAFARDSNGIIFVINSDHANYDKELEMWHEYFVMEQGTRQSNCIIFAHSRAKDHDSQENLDLPANLSRLHYVRTSLDEGSDNIRTEFNQFVSNVLSALTDNREQEELTIISQN